MGLINWIGSWRLQEPPVHLSWEKSQEMAQAVKAESLDTAMEAARNRYDEKEATRSVAEGKASTLLGFAGVTTGFVLAALSFVGDTQAAGSGWTLGPLLALGAVGVLLLGLAIGRAMQVLWIGVGSPFYEVKPDVVDDLASMSSEDAKRELLTSLTYCAANNDGPNNQKGTKLLSAQRYLAGGVAFVLLAILWGLGSLLAALVASSSVWAALRACLV